MYSCVVLGLLRCGNSEIDLCTHLRMSCCLFIGLERTRRSRRDAAVNQQGLPGHVAA